MTNFVIRLYDFFSKRRWLLGLVTTVFVLLCIISVSHIHFTEDISAFLPSSKHTQETDLTEKSLLNANSLVVSVGMTDTLNVDRELIGQAIDTFLERLQNTDGFERHIESLSSNADLEQGVELMAYVLENLPYMLTIDDYACLDTLLTGTYIRQCMQENRQIILTPIASAIKGYIMQDPLHLSRPILQKMQQQSSYEIDGNYIFSKATQEGIITIESAYPVSDAIGNSQLLKIIDGAAKETSAFFNNKVAFHTFGAAEISLSNTRRIKKDSLLSIIIAVLLILFVLIYAFRNGRRIFLMIVSLAFGWLFALGIIGVFKADVSIIAIGITSIIVGIALNYPLHLILHYQDNGDIYNTLREIAPPLTTGNITTIAAFLSLLLVNASAMRDMGLFAALLLLGVILFVLVILPHGLKPLSNMATYTESNKSHRPRKQRMRKISRWVPTAIVLLTCIFLPLSNTVSFETDMSKINYLTERQKKDMKMYIGHAETLTRMIPDDEGEQSARLAQWKTFIDGKKDIWDSVRIVGAQTGFSATAFTPFYNWIATEYHPKTTVSAGKILQDMVATLSNDFNWVLFVCGIVVFVFLCIMLGRLELGLIAFLPLTIGWIWILGLMGLIGIDFNIVNIILATLIFGQGDDYTIFITEGLMYEYAYGKKLVYRYRRSILLSAIIMFIGIGSLIVAKHPAMRSLGEVTVIGMGVVVLMAFWVPTFLFRWITASKGRKRRNPVTMINYLRSLVSIIILFFCSLAATVAGFFLFTVTKSSDKKKLWYHKLINRTMRFYQKNIFAVEVAVDGKDNLNGLDKSPAVIIANHQSHLDLMCVLALYPKLIILTKNWVSNSHIYGLVTRYADFYSIENGLDIVLDKIGNWVKKGYSIMIFPEGARSVDCSIGRFHSGAFHLAQKFNLDIIPILLHGTGHILPKNDFMLRGGKIHVKIYPRVSIDERSAIEQTRNMRHFYQQEYALMQERVETYSYFADTVLLNFIYKGGDVKRGVRKEYMNLCTTGKLDDWKVAVENAKNKANEVVLIEERGYGLHSLFYALVHKTTRVRALFTDADKALLMENCSIKPNNLEICQNI